MASGTMLWMLPPEVLSETFDQVNTSGILALWATGCKALQYVMQRPRVVKRFNVIRMHKKDTEWDPKVVAFERFPHLHIFYLYSRDHEFSAPRPSVHLNLEELPPSITTLHLSVGNAEKLMIRDIVASGPLNEPTNIYQPLDKLFPNLKALELTGIPVLKGSFFQCKFPETMTRLALTQNELMTVNDLSRLPTQVLELHLSDLKPEEATDKDLLPVSPTLTSLSLSSRLPLSILPLLGLLPAGLKKLHLGFGTELISSDIISKMPEELEVLELSSTQLPSNLSCLSRFPRLTTLSFNASRCGSDVSKHLPRSLKRLSMRRYALFDDSFWVGLPKTLTSLSAMSYIRPPRRFDPPIELTRACICEIPPKLTSLDISSMSQGMETEDFGLLPRGLTRVCLPSLPALGAALLPRTIASISVKKVDMTEDLVRALPAKLRRFDSGQMNIIEPSCLSLFGAAFEELSMSGPRIDRVSRTEFQQEWVQFLPALRRFTIRTVSPIDDDFFTFFSPSTASTLVHLEVHGSMVKFTNKCIPLIPKKLSWLEIDGVDDWTFDALKDLPQTLSWLYVWYHEVNGNRPTISEAELAKILPKGLKSHNLPTTERARDGAFGQGFGNAGLWGNPVPFPPPVPPVLPAPPVLQPIFAIPPLPQAAPAPPQDPQTQN